MEPRETIVDSQEKLQEEFKEVMDAYNKDNQKRLDELQELQFPPYPSWRG